MHKKFLTTEDMKRKTPDNFDEDAAAVAAAPSRRRCRMDPYLEQFKASGLSPVDIPLPFGPERERLRKKFDRFSSKYLMYPPMWELRTQLEPNMSYERYVELTKRALSDFYSKSFFYDEDTIFPEYKDQFQAEFKPFDRLMEWQYWTKMTDDCIAQAGIKDVEPMLKEALSFPHSQLQEVCWYYEEFSGTPMTRQLRQQLLYNKKLYKQIKTLEAEENHTVADWFKVVTQTKDLRYIVQNVEARIAREIDAQIDEEQLKPELWQMYIKYLLTKDQLLAEEVYHRFRRLFIDNRSLASNFPNYRGKLSNDAKSAMEAMKFNTPYIYNTLPSAPLTIYSNSASKQLLPFRNSMMHYIYTNASQKVVKMLYSSCKYFYLAKRKLLCHSLYIGKDLKLQYFRNSMSSTGEESEFAEMDKLIVQNTMIVQHSENPNLMHTIYPKLEACSIRFLRITRQTFYVKEYDFLTSAGKIMKLVFQKVSIIDENGEPIILEHFLHNLPAAMYIDAPIKTRTTPETRTMLFNWDKPQKIHCISILLDDTLMEILKPMKLFAFLERLVVNVKKSTNVVQFEKGNENISNYLQDLIQATQIYKHRNGGKAPPKVLTLKDYENLL
jgi:hypothetical protein